MLVSRGLLGRGPGPDLARWLRLQAGWRNGPPPEERTPKVKYMILTFASQQDYQEMVGRPSERPAWITGGLRLAIGMFMHAFNQELLESEAGISGDQRSQRSCALTKGS